jgi:hypothetical protein
MSESLDRNCPVFAFHASRPAQSIKIASALMIAASLRRNKYPVRSLRSLPC